MKTRALLEQSKRTRDLSQKKPASERNVLQGLLSPRENKSLNSNRSQRSHRSSVMSSKAKKTFEFLSQNGKSQFINDENDDVLKHLDKVIGSEVKIVQNKITYKS